MANCTEVIGKFKLIGNWNEETINLLKFAFADFGKADYNDLLDAPRKLSPEQLETDFKDTGRWTFTNTLGHFIDSFNSKTDIEARDILVEKMRQQNLSIKLEFFDWDEDNESLSQNFCTIAPFTDGESEDRYKVNSDDYRLNETGGKGFDIWNNGGRGKVYTNKKLIEIGFRLEEDFFKFCPARDDYIAESYECAADDDFDEDEVWDFDAEDCEECSSNPY